MSNDLLVQVTGLPGTVSISKKPPYLIVLEETSGKSKVIKKFITLDKPELMEGFVQVKGIFSDLPEDEIIKSFFDILTTANKGLFLEVLIPWHKISYIRSLIFKQK
jgi:hypothetical protein